MKSFSNNKKHGILCKAAAFIMTFLLMFTIIVPDVPVFGGSGDTAHAGSTSPVYRVLAVAAVYNNDDNIGAWYEKVTWQTIRNECWKKIITNRIQSVTSKSVQVDLTDIVHSMNANCLNVDLVETYDYIVFIANNEFRHVGDEKTYGTNDSRMKMENEIWQSSVKSVESGNDITASFMKKVEQFYDCGYPVEFMNKVTYNGSPYGIDFKNGMGSSVQGSENETNIAKLYQYVGGDNRIINGDHSADADDRIKNAKNVNITVSVSAPAVDAQGYANSGNEASKMLGYTFKINDPKAASSSRYTAQFYIDMNNDGRFDEELEGLSYMGITLASNNKKNIESNALQAGVEYRLVVNASKYTGLFNWKLCVLDNSAPKKRFNSESGSCKLHLMKGQSKEKIRVLQLTAIAIQDNNKSQYTSNNVYLPTADEIKWFKENNVTKDNLMQKVKASPGNLFNVYKGDNTKIYDLPADASAKMENMYTFYNYMSLGEGNEKGVLDYDISVDRVHVTDLDRVVKEAKGSSDWNTIYHYLTDNYDMLILGFADCYDDISSQDVCSGIEAFISEGKSVLFTHDTSSFVNNTSGVSANKRWGYNVNKYFRNILGMDRFGITLTDAQRKAQEKDYNNRGLSYIQGYTRSVLADGGAKNGNSPYLTTLISRVNKGPITTYPYEISEQQGVAQTHGQYYQLDLESDDIVVWYALAGGGNSYYSKTYNDGRDNYYIYNKGNITYSGVGHKVGLSNNEIKLFTNTMIAAYRTGDSTLSIEVTDWDASSTETTIGNKTYDYVTLPVDYIKKSTGGAYGENIVNNGKGTSAKQYRRVKFKIYDKTVAANKKVSINFYTSSSKTDTQGVSKLNYYAGSIYRMSDGKAIMKDGKLQSGQKLESGTEYYIYVPLSAFSVKQIFRGEVKAEITPSGQSNNLVITNSVFVNFNNRLQFNLG